MMPICRVLVADPAWETDDELPGDSRGAASNYDVMSTQDICKIQIPPTEPNALLFLWRISSMLRDALDVCAAWGFTPHSELVWNKLTKGSDRRRLTRDVILGRGFSQLDIVRQVQRYAPRHFGMGRIVRGAHESCLIGVRGRASLIVESKGERSVFDAPVGEHSAKPDEFYSIVERISKGPYVELYARRARPGWHCLGKDLGHVLTARSA